MRIFEQKIKVFVGKLKVELLKSLVLRKNTLELNWQPLFQLLALIMALENR